MKKTATYKSLKLSIVFNKCFVMGEFPSAFKNK